MTDPYLDRRYFRAERLNVRTGQWRQISPEGMGSLDACKRLYAKVARTMKRGTIRLVSSQGEVRMEHAADAARRTDA